MFRGSGFRALRIDVYAQSPGQISASSADALTVVETMTLCLICSFSTETSRQKSERWP